MNALATAAALLQHRHDADDIVRITRAAIDAEDDPKDMTTDLVLLLVGLLHTAGHNSPRVDVILDIFASIPAAVQTGGPIVLLAKNTDLADDEALAVVFRDMTEDTHPADRVWTAHTMGDKAAVALEGSGIAPRYLIIVGGTTEDAEALRLRLATLDGR
jgi:hypothetical protein